MPPPKVKAKKLYPIHQTAPGPDYMTPTGYETYNPIKEGTVFQVKHKGQTVKFRVDMNFYRDPRFIVMEVLEVK